MDIALKAFVFIVAMACLVLAAVAIKAAKYNKWSLLIAAWFAGIGVIMLYLLYHNCNYGVCNI